MRKHCRKGATSGIERGLADDRKDTFAVLAREVRHARGRFAFQGLQIEPTFAGDDHVSLLNFGFRSIIVARGQSRTEVSRRKAHETKGQTAGCAAPDRFSKIAAQILRGDIGQPRQCFFQRSHLIRCSAFL